MRKLVHFFRKRRNGGFTLVEMIVAVAVLAVLMVGMIITVSPIVQSFNDNSRDLVAENVATCIDNFISLRTRNATSVMIFGNTNEASIKSNANSRINKLKLFAQTKTSDNKNAYTLKCISLRYDIDSAKYYLFEETIDPTQTSDFADPFDNKGTRHSVFSNCFYDDLFYNISFEKAPNFDPATQAAQPRLPATLLTSIDAFSDDGYNNLVFSGSGLTEYREIIRDKVKNETKAKYVFEIYNGTSATAVDSFTTAGATDNLARDVFIFYTVYNYNF